jgi:hypothetical protein
MSSGFFPNYGTTSDTSRNTKAFLEALAAQIHARIRIANTKPIKITKDSQRIAQKREK